MRTRRIVVLLTGGVLSGAMAGQAGAAGWVEVRSPHFTVYSEAGEKEARRTARQFERFRVAIAQVWPKAKLDPGIPILIIEARNEGSMKELLPQYWERRELFHPTGVFFRGTRRYYIILRTDRHDASRRRRDENNSFGTLYHEYMHLVVDLNFVNVPPWLNEGLAEFIEATVVSGDQIDVGRPVWPHIQLLREKGLLPTAALFKIDRSSPEYNERDRYGVFYAQSWALVHYLIMDPKAASAGYIWRLLSLSQGEAHELDPTARVLADPAELDRALKSYVTQDELSHRILKTEAAQEYLLRARKLPASEVAATCGLFQVQMNRPMEARALLEVALRLDPQQVAAREGLGTLALWEGKLDDARRLLAEAIQLPNASPVAYYSHALALLQPSPQTEDRLALAQVSLERAVSLDPAFADALIVLAQVSAQRGAALEDTLELMRRAVEFEPGVLWYRFAMARVLLSCGEIEQARDLANRILA